MRNDLLEAWLYIAEDSVDSADRLLDQIEIEMRRLLMQPEMDCKREELAASLRRWTNSRISSRKIQQPGR